MNVNGKESKGSTTLPIMIILTCFAQVIVLIRSSLLASQFGASMEMDAFSLSNSIVTFVFGILASGVPTIIIPHYVKKTKVQSINSFVSLIYVFLLFFFSIVFLCRFPLIRLLSGKQGDFLLLAGNLLIALIIGQFAVSVTNVTIAFFQSNNKYNLPRITALFSNSLLVLFLMINNDLTIYEYTMALSASLFFNFIIDVIFAYYYGWGFMPSFHLDEEVKKMIKTFFPIVFSSGVYQVSLFVDSAIVSRLETGQLTILSYSSQITNMVYTIIVSNLLAFSFTKIVKKTQSNGAQTSFWRIAKICHMFECLIVAGFLVVGKEAVGLFLGHGRFTQESVNIVYIGSCIYIFGQQVSIIRELMYRYFYSLGNTSIAAINSVIVSVSNIVISLILVSIIGYYGIIIGTVSAAFLSLIFSFVQFKCVVGFECSLFFIFKGFIKNLISCSITVVLVVFLKRIIDFNSRIIELLVFGFLTVICYCVIEKILDKDLITDIKMVLRKE